MWGGKNKMRFEERLGLRPQTGKTYLLGSNELPTVAIKSFGHSNMKTATFVYRSEDGRDPVVVDLPYENISILRNHVLIRTDTKISQTFYISQDDDKGYFEGFVNRDFSTHREELLNILEKRGL